MMIDELILPSITVNWRRIINLLLIVAMLVPLVMMAPASEAPLHAQPILLQMAAEQPEEMVRVIV